MPNNPIPRFWGYAAAVVGVYLATLARLAMQPMIGSSYPFATYMLVVLLAAWVAGLGPSILSLLLGGCAAIYFFFQPIGTLHVTDLSALIGLFLYLFISVVGISACESQRRARCRLEFEVSQRALVEASLRESEDHYRHAVELNPQIPWIANPDGHVTDFSGKWLELTGRSREDALGEGWYQIPDSEDLPEMAAAWKRSIEQGLPYDMEHRIRLADGSFRWMRSRAYPRRDDQGQILRWYGTTEDIHDRKVAEQALRVSEERFRLAADAVNGIIYEFDLSTCEVERTRGLFEVLGYHQYEVPSCASWWFDQIHPDDLPGIQKSTEEGLKSAGPLTIEYRVRHRDGRWLHVEDRSVVMRDHDGIARKVVGCSMDITDRKQAEDELAESRRLFEQIAGTTPDLVYVFDLARGETQYVNEGVERVLGYTADELAQLGPSLFGSLAHPEERHDDAEFDLLQPGEVHEHDMRMRHVSGDYRWLRCRESVFERDEEGRAIKIIGTAQDVTEQKRQREALAASEARFRELAEAMPQIVYVSGADGNLEFINQRWTTYTGCNVLDVDRHAEYIHPDDRDELLAIWKNALDNQTAFQAAFRLRRATDGEYRWFLTRALPIFDSQGTLEHWYGTSTDIHDQKLAEESLRDTDRRKNEFLAMLAHELRNPLAPIRNALSELEMSDENPESRRWACDVIDRQVRQLSNLVNDLLDVSRITQGKISLQRSPLDVMSFVNAAVESSRPLIDARGHRLDVRLAENPLRLHGDSTRLSQVVLNLLNNAAKYTPEGGHIELCVESTEAEVVIRVKDNGEGIQPEILASMFEMFTQAERSLDRSQGGLGVGLTLVKRLVEMHGGTVQARSDGHGLGSEFVVRLPRLVGDSGEPEPVRKRPSRAPGRSAPSRRIVVVDDSVDSRTSMSRLLTRLGHQVETAEDGFGAIDAVARFRPDLVFLDIGLPGMDGYEVARHLRLQAPSEPLQLVALTGYGSPSDRLRSSENGFDHHLVKPVEYEDLVKILSQSPLAKTVDCS